MTELASRPSPELGTQSVSHLSSWARRLCSVLRDPNEEPWPASGGSMEDELWCVVVRLSRVWPAWSIRIMFWPCSQSRSGRNWCGSLNPRSKRCGNGNGFFMCDTGTACPAPVPDSDLEDWDGASWWLRLECDDPGTLANAMAEMPCDESDIEYPSRLGLRRGECNDDDALANERWESVCGDDGTGDGDTGALLLTGPWWLDGTSWLRLCNDRWELACDDEGTGDTGALLLFRLRVNAFFKVLRIFRPEPLLGGFTWPDCLSLRPNVCLS